MQPGMMHRKQTDAAGNIWLGVTWATRSIAVWTETQTSAVSLFPLAGHSYKTAHWRCTQLLVQPQMNTKAIDAQAKIEARLLT